MNADFGAPKDLAGGLQQRRSLYQPTLPPCLQVTPFSSLHALLLPRFLSSMHAPSLLCPCFLVSWVGFSAGYSICARLQAVLVTDMGGMIRGLQFQRPRFFAFEFSGQECLNTCSFGEDLFGFESFSPSSEFRWWRFVEFLPVIWR